MTITPEQADQWAQRATDGQWEHYDDYGMISLKSGDQAIATDLNEWDADLLAAAPDLAQTIAGMQWEYIFQEKVPSGGPWKKILSTTTWPLDHCQDVLARMQSELPEKKYRLIRRLVSKPEEIS